MTRKGPTGPEYLALPGIDRVKAQFHKIQVAIGLLPKGGETDTRKLLHQTELLSPVISNYTYKMACITVTEDAGVQNGSGDTPSLITRDSLPHKELCDGCDRVANCVLWLIAKGELDRDFIPGELREQVII